MKKHILFFVIAFAGFFPNAAPADELTRGLVGWWKLDGNLTDASGNGNNGTVGAGSAAYAAGVYGQAFDFAVNRAVNVPAELTLNALTISFWIKPEALSPTIASSVLSSRSNISNGSFIFLLGAGNYHWDHGGTANRWNTGLAPSFNTWTHLTFVRNSDSRMLYRNGELFAIRSEAGAIFAGHTYAEIGRDPATGTYRWGFGLDNLKIYNRALAPHEIRALYALGSPIGAAP